MFFQEWEWQLSLAAAAAVCSESVLHIAAACRKESYNLRLRSQRHERQKSESPCSRVSEYILLPGWTEKLVGCPALKNTAHRLPDRCHNRTLTAKALEILKTNIRKKSVLSGLSRYRLSGWTADKVSSLSQAGCYFAIHSGFYPNHIHTHALSSFCLSFMNRRTS